jgi:GTPase
MTGDPTETPDTHRCGYVAIIGEPNVGKSTLMNALIGQKLSIVTPKPQTTRHKILGIHSADGFQAIFLDTPGIITPKYLLHEAMMASAASALADADIVLFMIDACDPKITTDIAHETAFALLKNVQKPVFLVINKADMVNKVTILPVIEFYAKAFPFKEIFPISALKQEGTSGLLATIGRLLPEHPPLYPKEEVTEKDERFFASEIIREKIFQKYQQEIPYSTSVEIVEFKERGAGKTFISADIFVERESQKGILIGSKGEALKLIGRWARKDIEALVQHPVFLELHVKVRKDWREDKDALERFGYSRSRE